MRRSLFLLAILVTLGFFAVGCGEDVNYLEGGSYVASELPPSAVAGHWLTIDLSNYSGELVYPDGDTLDFEITVLDESYWYDDCFHNFGSTLCEVVKIELEEIVLGDRVITNPMLKTG